MAEAVSAVSLVTMEGQILVVLCDDGVVSLRKEFSLDTIYLSLDHTAKLAEVLMRALYEGGKRQDV